jgi:hypothetical protein
MKKIIPAFLLVLLISCSPVVTQIEGAPTGMSIPQASDQCRAQPELPWCK